MPAKRRPCIIICYAICLPLSLKNVFGVGKGKNLSPIKCENIDIFFSLKKKKGNHIWLNAISMVAHVGRKLKIKWVKVGSKKYFTTQIPLFV